METKRLFFHLLYSTMRALPFLAIRTIMDRVIFVHMVLLVGEQGLQQNSLRGTALGRDKTLSLTDWSAEPGSAVVGIWTSVLVWQNTVTARHIHCEKK